MFQKPTLTVATATTLAVGNLPHAVAARLHPAKLLVAFFDLLLAWQERARQRYDLQSLDDRMRADIGLCAVEIDREISKPFWMA